MGGAGPKKSSAASASSGRSSPDGLSLGTGGPLRRTRSENTENRMSPGRLGRRDTLTLATPGRPVGGMPARGPAAGLAGGAAPGGGAGGAANTGPTAAAMAREAEDLKSTIKILEKKRAEDREKLKLLERVQGERDKFETIIQKLQGS